MKQVPSRKHGLPSASLREVNPYGSYQSLLSRVTLSPTNSWEITTIVAITLYTYDREWYKHKLLFFKNVRVVLLSGVYTDSNHSVATEKPLKMAIKWGSASGEPTVDSRSWMLYLFSGKWAATIDHADLNLLLYRFRPSPIYRRQKPFGGKCGRCSGWSPLCAAWTKLIVYAAPAHSGTVPLDWRKLMPIYTAHSAAPLTAATRLTAAAQL